MKLKRTFWKLAQFYPALSSLAALRHALTPKTGFIHLLLSLLLFSLVHMERLNLMEFHIVDLNEILHIYRRKPLLEEPCRLGSSS